LINDTGTDDKMKIEKPGEIDLRRCPTGMVDFYRAEMLKFRSDELIDSYDLWGSRAHVLMLHRQGSFTRDQRRFMG
jgi:argininosuccinate lyase